MRETADFVDDWFPLSLASHTEDTCRVTLAQFVGFDSLAEEAAPHVYYWRRRQCLYSGNCSDAKAIWGPIWTFTVERPPPETPPAAVVPPPASMPPPSSGTLPQANDKSCGRARATLRNMRRRTHRARRAYRHRHSRGRRRQLRRLRRTARRVGRTHRICRTASRHLPPRTPPAPRWRAIVGRAASHPPPTQTTAEPVAATPLDVFRPA